MSHSIRLDFPGAVHHVFNRGARRRPVFLCDQDRQSFVALIEGLPQRFGVRVLAWCLMGNHVHLVLLSVRGNLAAAMQHLFSSYVPQFNERHGLDGPLFRGRYQNRVVLDDAYLAQLALYVHLNPCEGGVVRSPDDYRWSSHRAFAGLEPMPSWLEPGLLLDAIGGVDGYRAEVEQVLLGEIDLDLRLAETQGQRLPHTALVQPPEGTLLDTAAALAQVAAVCGCAVDDLLQSTRGPLGNAGRKVAAWWLLESSGLRRTELSEVLQLSPSGISTAAARVRRAKAGDVARIRAELVRRHGAGLREGPSADIVDPS